MFQCSRYPYSQTHQFIWLMIWVSLFILWGRGGSEEEGCALLISCHIQFSRWLIRISAKILLQRLCYLFSFSFSEIALILESIFVCSLLTLLVLHIMFFQVFWAFSIYLEAVAILPQLVLLQRSGNVDNLTGQYVFFLGYASSPVNLATFWKDIVLQHMSKIVEILFWSGRICFLNLSSIITHSWNLTIHHLFVS